MLTPTCIHSFLSSTTIVTNVVATENKHARNRKAKCVFVPSSKCSSLSLSRLTLSPSFPASLLFFRLFSIAFSHFKHPSLSLPSIFLSHFSFARSLCHVSLAFVYLFKLFSTLAPLSAALLFRLFKRMQNDRRSFDVKNASL